MTVLVAGAIGAVFAVVLLAGVAIFGLGLVGIGTRDVPVVLEAPIADTEADDDISPSTTVPATPELVPETIFPGGIKIIRRLPQSDREVRLAHESNATDACETILPGEPIEKHGFLPYLTAAERAALHGVHSVTSTRQHLFSVGIDFLDEDRHDLPFLSGGEIAKFFRGRYVVLQARVRKVENSGQLFLHHRSLGAMTQFNGNGLAEAVTTGVEASFRDYRGLGLVLKPEELVTPDNLRTLAILHKSDRLARSAENNNVLTYRYEYVFVRAHEENTSDRPRLRLHSFLTSENRTKLHYVRFASTPRSPNDCSVTTMITFTEYDQFGLRPKTSATRSMVYQDQQAFTMAQLDRYATEQGWSGGALDHLSETLDAIIAGDVRVIAERGDTERGDTERGDTERGDTERGDTERGDH